MWKSKTEYWTIVTAEQLETQVPESVVEFMGYDKNITHTLASTCFPFPQELEDGRFLINIQLSTASHYTNKCVNGFITEAGYNLAVQFYGEENIFEYEEVDTVEDIITFELE